MLQEMILLGTGTALADADRDNTCLLWNAADHSVLIDCGGRTYQQILRAGCDPLQLRALVLTHEHPDHVYGVPALLFALWLAGYQRTLDLYANPPTQAMVEAMCLAMNMPQKGYMCPIRWHTLSDAPETLVFATDTYSLYTTPVAHSVPCLGLKIVDHLTKRTLVYSADTEPCPTLDAFAAGAHTLIHEATVPVFDPTLGHTTPQQAGEAAVRAGVEQLVLVHYSAVYTLPEAAALAQVQAAGYTGRVALGRELERYAA